MVFQLMKLNIEVSDDTFNEIYPENIRRHAKRHGTPVAVAKLAAEFLAEKPGAKILDIGAGAGKFCMVGAASTTGNFTGVEQRKSLYDFCVKAAHLRHLSNVRFIHANITSIDFTEYTGFYFFNSFRENIDRSAVIDETVETGVHLLNEYNRHVYEQLRRCGRGTRVATYWTSVAEVPSDYTVVGTAFEGKLKMFEKRS